MDGADIGASTEKLRTSRDKEKMVVAPRAIAQARGHTLSRGFCEVRHWASRSRGIDDVITKSAHHAALCCMHGTSTSFEARAATSCIGMAAALHRYPVDHTLCFLIQQPPPSACVHLRVGAVSNEVGRWASAPLNLVFSPI
jgi:hypothetical protein